MTCEHHRFTTLSPATIDKLADTFDAATLHTMRGDAQQLADSNGPAAQAWDIIAGTLTKAHERRAYDERPHHH
jgi:hypothetical protein